MHITNCYGQNIKGYRWTNSFIVFGYHMDEWKLSVWEFCSIKTHDVDLETMFPTEAHFKGLTEYHP